MPGHRGHHRKFSSQGVSAWPKVWAKKWVKKGGRGSFPGGFLGDLKVAEEASSSSPLPSTVGEGWLPANRQPFCFKLKFTYFNVQSFCQGKTTATTTRTHSQNCGVGWPKSDGGGMESQRFARAEKRNGQKELNWPVNIIWKAAQPGTAQNVFNYQVVNKKQNIKKKTKKNGKHQEKQKYKRVSKKDEGKGHPSDVASATCKKGKTLKSHFNICCQFRWDLRRKSITLVGFRVITRTRGNYFIFSPSISWKFIKNYLEMQFYAFKGFSTSAHFN